MRDPNIIRPDYVFLRFQNIFYDVCGNVCLLIVCTLGNVTGHTATDMYMDN